MNKFFLGFLCLMLSGCASFDGNTVGNKVYPPTSPVNIEILEQAPSEPYEVIGDVNAEGQTFAVQENMKERLKEKAAEMGGDAIILKVKVDTYKVKDDGVLVGSTYGVDVGKIATKKMSGQVIRFTGRNAE
ncbi:MAG: hypothetical protein M0R00_06080 [Candidatus Omnitrophica bacterium]|nr:hypothetical protein [Candidatus Omnitrophota bacterium]